MSDSAYFASNGKLSICLQLPYHLPKTESYGTVAVFADLYGNLWDLVEFRRST